MALASAGGAVAGIGIGAAAFGINALALGPGALVGGAVLCVKGVSLSKKATKNKLEAVQLKKDVEKICAYHAQLRGSAGMLYQSMLEVRQQYLSHLSALKTPRVTENRLQRIHESRTAAGTEFHPACFADV